MRILSIRGENLAALADPFEIDLTAEPLQSAGLFAITGPTAAGKSTILDAICLALYGTCPRLKEVGVDDNIIDISGERIKSTDPRCVMRTGAAYCWAEVDFTGMDGQNYTARWSVRRARGNVAGRMQAPERELSNKDQGKVLADQISTVNARVADIVGLTYDEFRRTVILPQGEFDAFLQANAGKRAAILEKVTGTEIYRKISRRIYGRAAEEKQAVTLLEARQGEHRLLTDDERSGIVNAVTELKKLIGTEEEALSALRVKAEKHREVAELGRKQSMAQTAHDSAQAAFDAEEPMRNKLERFERAEPLRTPFATMRNARQASGSANCRLADARRVNEQAEADHLNASKDAREAADEMRGVEATYLVLEPDWSRATALDNKITDAAIRKTEAQLSADSSSAQFSEASVSLETLRSSVADQGKQLSDIETILTDRAGIGNFARDWALTSERVGQRSSLNVEAGMLEAAIGKNEALIEGSKAHAEENRKNARKAANDVLPLTRERDEIELQVAETGQAFPSGSLEAAIGIRNALQEVRQLCVEITTSTGQESDLRKDLAITSDEKAEAERRLQQITKELSSADEALLEIEAPALRAQAAASEAAIALRQHLHDGDPCPVCRSTNHPVASDAEFQKLAKELQSLVESRKGVVRDLRQRIEQENAKLSRFAAREGELTERIAALSAQISCKKSDTDAKLLHIPEMPGYDGVRKGRAPFQEDELSAILADTELRLEAIRTADQQMAGHAQRMREIDAMLKTLREAQSSAEQIALNADLTMSNASAEIKGSKARLQQVQGQIEALNAAIAPKLAYIGATIESLDKEGILEKLGNLVEWWEGRVGQRDQIRDKLSSLAPQLATAEVRHSAAEAESDRCAKALGLADDKLSELSADRAKLLDGRPTDEHRKGWNERRRVAREKHESATRKLNEKATALAQSQERVQALTEEACRIEETVKDTNSGFILACKSADLDPELVAEIFTTDPDTLIELRARARQIAQALESTASVLRQRQADYQTAISSWEPTETEEMISFAISEAEAKSKQARQTVGAKENELTADDRARENLDGLIKELGLARYDLETWEAVNAAVGQENGNRFAQFAQSVTLGVLIERANIHLRDFNPRYHLEHGGDDLSIQVVDNHMGGDRRSTNSISGGELFLVSLSLALGLSGMGGNGGLAGTIFIDEGFGTLDRESLDVAFNALERLQSEGRTVGIISHVDAMKERVPVKVEVRKRGAGKSQIKITA